MREIPALERYFYLLRSCTGARSIIERFAQPLSAATAHKACFQVMAAYTVHCSHDHLDFAKT